MKKSNRVLLISLLLLFVAALAGFSCAAASNAKPARVSGLQITTNGKAKTLKLSWNRQGNVKGYQVYRSESGKKGSYNRIAVVKKPVFADSGLKHSKTYYYAVRAYAKQNGKNVYGAFSKVNLSTRITKAYARKLLLKSFWVSKKWICDTYGSPVYDFPLPAYAQENLLGGMLEEGGYCYYEVQDASIHTIKQLKKYLYKYFEKTAVDEFIALYYLEIDNHLYHLHIDHGGTMAQYVLDDTKVLKITYDDNLCVIKYQTHDILFEWDPDYREDEYSTEYETLYYQNGRWVLEGWYFGEVMEWQYL